MARRAGTIALSGAMGAVLAAALVFAAGHVAPLLMLPAGLLVALTWHRARASRRADAATGRPATPGRRAGGWLASFLVAVALLYAAAVVALGTTVLTLAALPVPPLDLWAAFGLMPGAGRSAFVRAAVVLGGLVGVATAVGVARRLWPRAS